MNFTPTPTKRKTARDLLSGALTGVGISFAAILVVYMFIAQPAAVGWIFGAIALGATGTALWFAYAPLKDSE